MFHRSCPQWFKFMTKSKVSLLFLILVILTKMTQGMQVTGSFPLGVNQTMTVEICNDFISQNRTVIGRIPIDASGHFTFDVPVAEEHHVFYFRLGRWEGVFYGNHNGSYEIEIPTLKNNEPIKFDKAEIPVIWLNGSDDLHRLVLNYYKGYNNFLEEHYFDFAAEKAIGKEEQRVHIQKKGKGLDMMPENFTRNDSIQIAQFIDIVQTFDDSLRQSLPINHSPFLFALHEYSMARLYLIAQSPRTALWEKYFGSVSSPLYQHPAYVQALELYFNDFLSEGNKKFIQDSQSALTSPIGLQQLEMLLNEYHILEQSSHRYAAIITYLQHGFNQHQIGANAYQMMLQQIADRVITQNLIGTAEKPICQALIDNSRKCLKEFAMPVLVGKDLKNKKWDNTNITGKLTYIVFYATWNAYSMKQLQAFERLAIKFNGAAHFVAISLDEDEQTWRNAVQNKKWKMQMVFLGDQPEVREQCCISNIPFAILLDDQGVYINDYTRLPEDPQMGVQIERWLLAHPDKAGKGTWKEN